MFSRKCFVFYFIIRNFANNKRLLLSDSCFGLAMQKVHESGIIRHERMKKHDERHFYTINDNNDEKRFDHSIDDHLGVVCREKRVCCRF